MKRILISHSTAKMKNFLMFSLRYSAQNLRRNPRRSVLLIALIGFTLGISLIANSYASGVMGLWKQGAIDTGTGHAQVHKVGYWEKQEGIDQRLALNLGGGVEQILSRDSQVEQWSRRLRFEGLMVSDSGSAYFVGNAIEPEPELKVSPRMYNPPYDQGDFVRADISASAAIGEGLAKLLNLSIGSDATLVAQTSGGSVNAIDVKIVGIIDVPLPSFSKRSIFVNLQLAQRLLRLPNSYTEIGIRLGSNVDATTWVAKNLPTFATQKSDLRGWWDVEPLIRKVEMIWSAVSGLLCLLLVVSAVLTVMNVIFMMVNERKVEIGTLAAMGARPWMLRLLFAFEGSMVGIIGGAFGGLLAWVCIGAMAFYGIPFESPFGSGIETIYPYLSFNQIVIACFISTILCALCALPPAQKAISIEPAQAVRGLS